MAKLAATVFGFRIVQLLLSLAFVIFWAWACAAHFVIGGGPGAYFLGFFTAIVSLSVCAHGLWSYLNKAHEAKHPMLYHHARWALDLLVTVLWVAAIVIEIAVPIATADQERSLYSGGPDQPPNDHIVVVGMGVNATQLFSAITFCLTGLLLIVPAVRARKATGTAEDEAQGGDAQPPVQEA